MLTGGCTAGMTEGGVPTPTTDTTSEWGENISAPQIQISSSEADKVLTELYGVIGKITSGTLYLSDITYMREVSDYLAQYRVYNSETAIYMHSVEQLLSAYCSLYARNIDTVRVQEVITDYVDGYYALSDSFKSAYSPIDNADLNDIMNKINILAEVSELSSATVSE